MSDELIHLQDRLKKLDQERAGILDQISKIHSKKSEANVSTCDNLHDLHINKAVDSHSSQEKRNIFLGLFRCRKDVYPKLWENIAQNKKGYSPVCKNEWIDGICPKKKKVKIKCGECTAHAFLPLDELAIKSHLQGTNTIGTYAIRDDDSCIFLACDFDGDGWKDDVISYKNSATALSVEVSVEISRSGNGAHAWIFFNDFIPIFPPGSGQRRFCILPFISRKVGWIKNYQIKSFVDVFKQIRAYESDAFRPTFFIYV